MADNQVVSTGAKYRWKPGQSGNPKGRKPKELSLVSLAKQYLEQVPAIQVGGQANTKTWRELLVQAWFVGAYKGNSALFLQLIERIDGKVVQRLEQSGPNGGPIEFQYTEATLLGKLEALSKVTQMGSTIGVN